MNIQSLFERNDTKAIRFYCLCLFTFTFGLYANTLSNEYALDDNIAIYTNAYVQAGYDKVDKIFTTPFYYGSLKEDGDNQIYRPIVTLSFASEIALFGKNPFFVHHLINIILYAFSVTLIFLNVYEITKGSKIALGFLTALFFALHPVHTEVIANIKSRDEIFSLLFGLLIPLYALLHYIKSEKVLFLIIAVVSFTIGLFSKENTVTFILLFPIILLFFLKLKKDKVYKIMLPLVASLILYLVIHYLVLYKFPDNKTTIVQNTLFGAKTVTSYYATAIKGMLIYLKLVFFPHPLIWDYSYNHIPLTSFTNPLVIISSIIHLILGLFFFLSLKRNPFISFCIAFYFITISINSNLFITTGAYLGERFLYTPSLAACLILSAIFLKVWQTPLAKNIVTVVILLIAITCSYQVITRNKEWKDTLTISLADIDKAPESIKIEGTLASAYSKLTSQISNESQRNIIYHKMVTCYDKMNAIYPYSGDTWLSLGSTYANLKNYDKAISCFNRSEALDPKNDKVFKYRSEMYLIKGNIENAFSDLIKYSEFRRDDDTSNYNLGWIYYQKNDLINAENHLLKAAGSPLFQKGSISMLTEIYERKKDPQKALECYLKLMQIAPNLTTRNKIDSLKVIVYEDILNTP